MVKVMVDKFIVTGTYSSIDLCMHTCIYIKLLLKLDEIIHLLHFSTCTTSPARSQKLTSQRI